MSDGDPLPDACDSKAHQGHGRVTSAAEIIPIIQII